MILVLVGFRKLWYTSQINVFVWEWYCRDPVVQQFNCKENNWIFLGNNGIFLIYKYQRNKQTQNTTKQTSRRLFLVSRILVEHFYFKKSKDMNIDIFLIGEYWYHNFRINIYFCTIRRIIKLLYFCIEMPISDEKRFKHTHTHTLKLFQIVSLIFDSSDKR